MIKFYLLTEQHLFNTWHNYDTMKHFIIDFEHNKI